MVVFCKGKKKTPKNVKVMNSSVVDLLIAVVHSKVMNMLKEVAMQ